MKQLHRPAKRWEGVVILIVSTASYSPDCPYSLEVVHSGLTFIPTFLLLLLPLGCGTPVEAMPLPPFTYQSPPLHPLSY